MSQHRNPLARHLRSPTWRQRRVEPKKGKGSFKRKPKHPKQTTVRQED